MLQNSDGENMKGKTVLITGATSGIGRETALALAARGAKVVFTARDAKIANETRAYISEKTGNDEIHVHFCRLDSFKSIREFCTEVLEKYKNLHVLINNAGIWESRRKESMDGIELTFAVNHLAPFLMTNLLLERIWMSAPARIINVSSSAHAGAEINFRDIEFKKEFPRMKAYSQSKLANILFTRLLAEKLTGSGVTVNCLHPGVVYTSIYRNINPVMRSFFRLAMISPEKGAKTSIFLASSPDVENISGEYFAKKKIAHSNKESHDLIIAERLWNLSEEYTGIK
jgi:NAD(P)-dependent dehydrogenase (short-subunit alcohol dehydrogenase family)